MKSLMYSQYILGLRILWMYYSSYLVKLFAKMAGNSLENGCQLQSLSITHDYNLTGFVH